MPVHLMKDKSGEPIPDKFLDFAVIRYNAGGVGDIQNHLSVQYHLHLVTTTSIPKLSVLLSETDALPGIQPTKVTLFEWL